MITKNDIVFTVIDNLKGTSLTLYEACCDAGMDDTSLSDEQLAVLEMIIYPCCECGIWFPGDEVFNVSSRWQIEDRYAYACGECFEKYHC